MWATQRRLMTTLSVLALVALFATAAAPNARAAPTTGATASAAANTCGANPSPPTSAPTIQIYNPLANQRVASPIRVGGLAIAAEARFGITLYDQNGAELAAIPVESIQIGAYLVGGLLGGLAGLLVLFTSGLDFTAPLGLTLSGFGAAIIFGIGSPLRGLFGGLAMGVAQALASGYTSGMVASMVPFLFILIVLSTSRFGEEEFAGGRP